MSILENLKNFLIKIVNSHAFLKFLVIVFSFIITITIAFSKVFENIKQKFIVKISEGFFNFNLQSKIDQLLSKSEYQNLKAFPLSLNKIKENQENQRYRYLQNGVNSLANISESYKSMNQEQDLMEDNTTTQGVNSQNEELYVIYGNTSNNNGLSANYSGIIDKK